MFGHPRITHPKLRAPSLSWPRRRKGIYGVRGGPSPPAILGVIALAAGLAAGALSHHAAATPAGSRFGHDYFGDVQVATHEGKAVPFYDGLIKGKKVVINFIYTNCNDICPLQTARMLQIRKRLGDLVGKDFFIYSITMDPEHDTAEVLKPYAEAFGAGGGWLFLTGNPQELHDLRWKLGERSRNLSEHRNDMVLGNDVTGEWSRSSVFEDTAVAVDEIRQLDPVYFNAKRKISSDKMLGEKAMRLDTQPGQALFIKGCSTCHTIGHGDRIGPDLKDIAKRRDRNWLTRFMIAPDRMRAEKDPLTMQLMEQYKGVKMPTLGLKEPDVEDLLSYISVMSKKTNGSAPPEPASEADASPDPKAAAPEKKGAGG